MQYTLLVTKGPDEGLSHPIRSRHVSVGRSSEMDIVLTDPAIRPRHFMVKLEDGGWQAVTYDEDATIIIDRRWEHPRTRERGARIFVGDSQLLLFAGDKVDVETAKAVSEGLDIDAETLRDEALTTVGSESVEFRHDMKGKATRVANDKRRSRGRDRSRKKPRDSSAPTLADGSGDSKMFTSNAGMMRLPATVKEGRRAKVPTDPPRSTRSSRSSWDTPGPSTSSPPQNMAQRRGGGGRSLATAQSISLTDTSVAAMPSQSRDLWVLYEKDGPFASELRILATRLEDLKGTFGYKTFLFTSVNPSEGKTVVSNNLSLVMSEDTERKIALVDTNFRAPRAGTLFNLDNSRGLISAISGDNTLSECVAKVVGRNLVVLNAGGEHRNPAQVLSDPRFKTLIAELSQTVDFMIIDAPSALPFADVPLLAQHVDAVFLVVAADKTKSGDLEKAIETIGRNRVVGTVFVNSDRKSKVPKVLRREP